MGFVLQFGRQPQRSSLFELWFLGLAGLSSWLCLLLQIRCRSCSGIQQQGTNRLVYLAGSESLVPDFGLSLHQSGACALKAGNPISHLFGVSPHRMHVVFKVINRAGWCSDVETEFGGNTKRVCSTASRLVCTVSRILAVNMEMVTRRTSANNLLQITIHVLIFCTSFSISSHHSKLFYSVK
jgi:hypothetical protein